MSEIQNRLEELIDKFNTENHIIMGYSNVKRLAEQIRMFLRESGIFKPTEKKEE